MKPLPKSKRAYKFEATEGYWRSFYALPPSQKESCRRAWAIFKEDPFDPRLRPHKIHGSSAQFGTPVYATEIEGDLRSLFLVKGETVVSLDLVSHDDLK